MTKDTAEFSQFYAVACREHTLPRDEDASEPKGWIRGNTKIGPVLKVATCCLHGKNGVEIRISHGSNKFVMNLNNNEQEIPEDQLEEYAFQLNAKDFACRAKARAQTQRRGFASWTCRPFHKNNTHWGKNLDQCWTRGIFTLRLCSIEEINSCSSTCKKTKRRWWSDWILES